MTKKANCITEYTKQALAAFNSGVAINTMQAVSKHHRVQASLGYRNAANEVLQIAKALGLTANIKTYNASCETAFFTQKMFKQWSCTNAYLEIEGMGRVCDFNTQEMSLIQRSANFAKTKAPIVLVKSDADICELQIKDKLIFSVNGYEKYIDKAIECGALGIITVSMPEIYPVRMNMANDKQMQNAYANLSYYHYSSKTENKLCGFVLTPIMGKQLEQLCIKAQENSTEIFACFEVDSKFENSTIENVEIEIDGQTDEEILITAHLCHPRSSVNDNVTGVCAGIEAMDILNRLVCDKILPKPTKKIKLLLIPEFTGTYAYLHENSHRLQKIKAGINLDMLAGKQDGNAGALIIVDTPDCAKSFMGDLAYIIMEELMNSCEFGRKGLFVPMFMGVKVPFVFGSDHYILSDPTIDVPSIALTQWPDKTYHTSVDDLQHIDINLLAKATALSAVYAYVNASFSADIFRLILPKISQRFLCRLNEVRFDECECKNAKMHYIKKLYADTLLNSLNQLPISDKEQLMPLINSEIEHFYNIAVFESNSTFATNLADNTVYERTFKAPLSVRSLLVNLSEEDLGKWKQLHNQIPDYSGIDDLIIYEIDGKSTIGEICERILMQTDIICNDYVKSFANLLLKLGLLKIKAT